MKGWEDVTEEMLSNKGIKYTAKTNKTAVAKRKSSTNIIKPKSKFNAVKTEINGIKFDSKKEANYYLTLLALKEQGEIDNIKMQVEYLLQPSFTRENGEKVKNIKYYADFVVMYKNGTVEVIDVKGLRTDVYKMKKKMLLDRYPNINFKEV